MGSTSECKEQRKESANFHTEQWKLPNLDNKENRVEKIINRASEICETITKDLTPVSSESQKGRRNRSGPKRYIMADNFPNCCGSCPEFFTWKVVLINSIL